MQNREHMSYTALVAAIIAGSIGPILIRMALGAGVDSVSIASLRLIFATAILTPIVLRRYRHQFKLVSRRQLLLIGFSGFWLALHFIGFIGALDNTTVLIAAVIVSTNPLWAAILETLILRVRAHPLVWAGIAFAIVGGGIIALGGGGIGESNPQPLLGGMLALLGAVASALYMLIGRKAQTRLSLVPYIWMVYGFAALTATTIALVSGSPLTGYSPTGYFWVIVITIVLQLLTHGSINFALRQFSATYISMALRISVVGNVLFALIFFDEVPKDLQIIGAVIVIGGVILASVGRGQRSED